MSSGLPTLFAIALLSGVISYTYVTLTTNSITSPFPGEKLKHLDQFSSSYKSELLWGSYRPGHYFGMRKRQPESMAFGMMWFDPESRQFIPHGELRHKAKQEDPLQSYGWLRHDGRSYGHQELIDVPYNITLHMVKQSTEWSEEGGDWALRVSVMPTNSKPPPPAKHRVALVFYVRDATAKQLSVVPEGKEGVNDEEGVKLMSGEERSGGTWSLFAKNTQDTPTHISYLAGVVDEEAMQKLDTITLDELIPSGDDDEEHRPAFLRLPDAVAPDCNMVMVQLLLPLGSTVDITFLSNAHHNTEERLNQLTGTNLARLISTHQSSFDRKFNTNFLNTHLPLDPSTLSATRAALSNLVGGMGYFYGSSKVQLPPSGADQPPRLVDYWPEALYSAVPSRSFFPRGFLWDEGFHQLLLRRWDAQLSRDVLAHWLDLMNKQGWIPREQILGSEARSRVPEEFVAQHPTHANPPSLFLVLQQMADTVAAAQAEGRKGDASAAADEAFLRAAWPRLKVWYEWYNTTQAGPVPGSFRWHGRDEVTASELNPKTLMSGLDDFPRASHPSGEERHLDLYAWMVQASRTMTSIGEVLRLPEPAVQPYRFDAARLSDPAHLQALHWDADQQVFADWGNHSEDVWLREDGTRAVGTPPSPQHIPHYGYLSLFPLLMKLLPPDSPLLPHQLDLLADPSLLWTPQGLRSLAPTSSLYQKYNTKYEKPYWRGPIWMNINYLAASSLQWYCQQGVAKACGLHKELQSNVVGNVVQQYEKTGYMWEQYNEATGGPSGCFPFTGWTALVALMAGAPQGAESCAAGQGSCQI